MSNDIITIGFNKDGEADFSIRSTICDLNYEQMNDFRAMCMVAIGSAEDMWRREQERLNPTSKTHNP